MIKFFVGLLLMMSTSLVSQAAVTVNDDPVKIDLTEMIEKAKTEGANWTEDEWKSAFREVMGLMTPMIKEMTALSKKAEALGDTSDIAAMMELQKEAEALQAKYEGVTQQIEEFGKIADSYEIGSRLGNDEEFQKELFTELGIADLINE